MTHILDGEPHLDSRGYCNCFGPCCFLQGLSDWDSECICPDCHYPEHET